MLVKARAKGGHTWSHNINSEDFKLFFFWSVIIYENSNKYEWREVHGSTFFQHSISGLMSFVFPQVGEIISGSILLDNRVSSCLVLRSPQLVSGSALSSAGSQPPSNLLTCADLPTFGVDALLEPHHMLLPSMSLCFHPHPTCVPRYWPLAPIYQSLSEGGVGGPRSEVPHSKKCLLSKVSDGFVSILAIG